MKIYRTTSRHPDSYWWEGKWVGITYVGYFAIIKRTAKTVTVKHQSSSGEVWQKRHSRLEFAERMRVLRRRRDLSIARRGVA